MASSFEGAMFYEVMFMHRYSPCVLLVIPALLLAFCSCGKVADESDLSDSSAASSTEISEISSESTAASESETTMQTEVINAPLSIEVWDTEDADYKHEYVYEFLDEEFESSIDESTSGWWNYNETMSGSSIYNTETEIAGYSLTLRGEAQELFYAYFGPDGDLKYSSSCTATEYSSFTSYDIDMPREGEWEIGKYYLVISTDPSFENMVFRASFDMQNSEEV